MTGSPFPGGSDNAVTAIHGHAGQLGAALAAWEARDDARPCPEARRAANTAIDAIDAMLRDLYAIRARLISEVRVSDDAAAARVDALLTRTDDDLTSSRDQASPGPAGPEGQQGRGAVNARPQRKGQADVHPP